MADMTDEEIGGTIVKSIGSLAAELANLFGGEQGKLAGGVIKNATGTLGDGLTEIGSRKRQGNNDKPGSVESEVMEDAPIPGMVIEEPESGSKAVVSGDFIESFNRELAKPLTSGEGINEDDIDFVPTPPPPDEKQQGQTGFLSKMFNWMRA